MFKNREMYKKGFCLFSGCEWRCDIPAHGALLVFGAILWPPIVFLMAMIKYFAIKQTLLTKELAQ